MIAVKCKCPKCLHPFPRKERGRELGGLWTPRVAACPSCGVQLRWRPWPWRLQFLAALLIIPAVLRPTPAPIRIACIVGALVSGILVWLTLDLEAAAEAPGRTPPDTEDNDA